MWWAFKFRKILCNTNKLLWPQVSITVYYWIFRSLSLTKNPEVLDIVSSKRIHSSGSFLSCHLSSGMISVVCLATTTTMMYGLCHSTNNWGLETSDGSLNLRNGIKKGVVMWGLFLQWGSQILLIHNMNCYGLDLLLHHYIMFDLILDLI